jgi:diguanylate cyclase (GGDEF)-like protein
VVLFSIVRLNELGKILAELSNETIPKVSYAASLNTEIQNLATLTAILTHSKNSPAQQLARQSVEKSIAQINKLLLSNSTDSKFLLTRLATLTKEIYELDDLVKQRIIYQREFNKTKSLLIDEIQSLIATVSKFQNIDKGENILVEVLLLSVDLSQQTRLHEIRQTEEALRATLNDLQTELLDKQDGPNIDIAKLEALLLDSEGLVNHKIQLLRVEGRTRGRDNFVRNLIADASSNLQYQAYVVNKASINDAHQVTSLAEQYSRVTFAAGLFAVLIALAIIYYLHKRIITRFASLSNQVMRASKSPDAIINIDGDDEVAKLANIFSSYLERVKEQENALLNMTLTDPLTAIPNRRAFENKIIETIDLAIRNQSDVTLILIDIDYFKSYNDHFGHSAGDACLRLVANELSKTLSRQVDFCGRFGGEEFVCILPNTDAAGAKAVAEKLLESIIKLQLPHSQSSANKYVTVSIGTATSTFKHNTHLSKEILLLEADKALYQAKAKGRNTYCQFE